MFAVIKRGSILEASSYITFSVWCPTSQSTTAPSRQKKNSPTFFYWKVRYKITKNNNNKTKHYKNRVRSILLNIGSKKLDRDESELIKSKHYCPEGNCKDWSNDVKVTIFRLANTILHQVYREDHEITEIYMQY